MAFATRPHAQYGDIAALWLTHPAGAVVQLLQPVRVTLEQVNWLVGPAYELLDRRFPNHNALTLVLDLADMTSRTAAARSTFLGKARQCGARFTRGYLVLPRHTSTAHFFSMRASITLVRALGVQVEIVDSPARAIAQADLHTAP
jgi:hypothetical protein